MTRSTSLAPGTPPSRTTQAHLALLSVLERLLTVGAFYPPGHAKCDEVVKRFIQTSAPVLAGADTLTLEGHGKGLRLQGVVMDPSAAGCSRWSDLLQTLGVARLDIRAGAPATELVDLVNKLLAMKLEADSSLQFKQLEFDHLPPSAAVHAREFGRRTGGSRMSTEAAGQVHALLDRMTDGLREKGLGEAETDALREQVEEFFVRVIERMETTDGAQSTETQRELKDVLDLGAHAVQGAVESMGQDLDDCGVSQLFGHASEALTYTRDKESIEMILSVFRQSSRDLAATTGSAEGTGPQPDTSDYDMSLPDLAAHLRDLAVRAVPLEGTLGDDPAEFLSIALALLTRTEDGPAADHLREDVKRLLAEAPDAAVGPLLEQSLETLLTETDTVQIDRLLPLLAGRQADLDPEACTDFWEHLCRDDKDRLTRAWPHLMNLVIDAESPLHGTHARRLLDLVTGLAPDDARPEVPRLAGLSACRTGRLSPGFCQMPLETTHVVLHHLLYSPLAEAVGRQLAKIWRASPPDEHIRFLLPALGPWSAAHLDLYRQLLEAVTLGGLSADLKDDIAQLIGHHLLGLDPVGRTKPAAAATAAYLGRLGSDRGRPVLRRIVTERKFLFFKAWPEPVRTKARIALDQLSEEAAR